eukprot:1971710-Prorocentrum_lima.AAC.1
MCSLDFEADTLAPFAWHHPDTDEAPPPCTLSACSMCGGGTTGMYWWHPAVPREEPCDEGHHPGREGANP